MGSSFSIHAHPRYLIVTDALVFVLIELCLVALLAVRVLISPLAFMLLSVAVLGGFGVDVGLWFLRGLRSVEIADDVLTTYRGPSLTSRTFRKATILRLTISRFPGARTVRFRMLSGQRVRIVENAFSRDDYTRLLSALGAWRR